MAANHCPSCHQNTAYVEAIERGIDYIVNEGYYAACSECEWESEAGATYEEAAKLVEGDSQQPTTGQGSNLQS